MPVTRCFTVSSINFRHPTLPHLPACSHGRLPSSWHKIAVASLPTFKFLSSIYIYHSMFTVKLPNFVSVNWLLMFAPYRFWSRVVSAFLSIFVSITSKSLVLCDLRRGQRSCITSIMLLSIAQLILLLFCLFVSSFCSEKGYVCQVFQEALSKLGVQSTCTSFKSRIRATVLFFAEMKSFVGCYRITCLR